jgi:energy-coupling factor transporter transmembrane protein EcfT
MLKKQLRRHGADSLIHKLNIITYVVWFFSVITLYMIFIARPPEESVFNRWHKARFGNEFDDFLLKYSIVFMIVCFALSVAGLIINKFRHKRKTDHYRLSLIILGLLSLTGIVLHILYL